MPKESNRDLILWRPSERDRDASHVWQWMRWLERETGVRLARYQDAWEWSVTELSQFWGSIWRYFGLVGDGDVSTVLARRTMPGAVWFPDLALNWAENVLLRCPDGIAVVSTSQTRDTQHVTGEELRDLVARAQAGLRTLGVTRGDRVVAYLPNITETLVLLLASASLGAVFSSCPPEFGIKGVLDRFGQVEPKVLVAVDGYCHRGKKIDRRPEIATICASLPSLEAVVLLPYLNSTATLTNALSWDEFMSHDEPLKFVRLPFEHPLYVLYSSGTTGPPKPIIHSHGGILLEHTKGHHFHHDLREGDRFFWFSTTGWVMWNYLVSGLLTGSSIVLFDGDPAYPDLGTLWRLAADEGVTVFGVSAPFLLSCRREGLHPGIEHDLSLLRQLGSTGAPLPADGYRWVYERVSSDVNLISVSGGTDVCGAFVAGVPILPVTAGEMTCRCLGVKVESYDEEGRPCIGKEGELVVTEPMPSMPVGFWGDHDNSRYRESYFQRFPGVWAHGDWITITSSGTCTISGRSDATLNRGGVRLGTSDFYSVVEALPGVADSLVVHIEDSEGGVGELILFVQLADDAELDGMLEDRIRRTLRQDLSPRHVPDTIVGISSIPRTLSGKKLEVPIKRLLRGAAADQVASRDSLLDPASLDPFVAYAERRSASHSGRSHVDPSVGPNCI